MSAKVFSLPLPPVIALSFAMQVSSSLANIDIESLHCQLQEGRTGGKGERGKRRKGEMENKEVEKVFLLSSLFPFLLFPFSPAPGPFYRSISAPPCLHSSAFSCMP